MLVIYDWILTTSVGYNKIILPESVQVNNGNFIVLKQTSSKIAINTAGNATYSDLAWKYTTQWTRLSESANWRFYLNAITNFTSYQTTFNIQHSYLNIGLYSLKITFPSGNQLFEQVVNITDCKFKICIKYF